MTNDDDSFLSAYMDGQLDPDPHQWVESALVSNPQLPEQLRGLTVVRDLVAGLARDTSVDVRPQVMRRIRARRHSPRGVPAFHSWPSGRARRFAFAGILTTAAGMILAISLAISHSRQWNRPQPATDRALAGDPAHAQSTAIRTGAGATNDAPGTRPASSYTGPSSAVAAGRLESGAFTHIGSVVEATGSFQAHDPDRVRQFLDSPNLRRFVVRSGRDGKGEELVASVVERTTRYGFFKFTVAQGIVIDARHPEEATVFTLLVNPKELDQLRDQLKVALPDLIEETPVDPGIATQLADIGQVQTFQPAALADVSIPREDVALKTRVASAAENVGPPDLSKKASRRTGPTLEQERSAPLPAAARAGSSVDPNPEGVRTPAPAPASRLARAPDAPGPAKGHPLAPIPGTGDGRSAAGAASIARPAEGPDDQIVVLVWVCKPSKS